MHRGSFVGTREERMLRIVQSSISMMNGAEPETAHNLSVVAYRVTDYLVQERERAYFIDEEYKEKKDAVKQANIN